MDGIEFINSSYIMLLVDGDEVQNADNFKDSLIYFKELKKSAVGAGKYLIFTCACGIADDGGWDGVFVQHDVDIINWQIPSINIRWRFSLKQYVNNIERIESELVVGGERLNLEPKDVVFPENW